MVNKKSQEGGLNWIVVAIILLIAAFIIIIAYNTFIGKEKKTIVSAICELQYKQANPSSNPDCPCPKLECKDKAEIEQCFKEMVDWCKTKEIEKKTVSEGGASGGGGAGRTYEQATETAKATTETPSCTGSLVDPPFTKGCASGETCKIRESIMPVLKKASDLAKNEGKELQLLSGYRSEAEQKSIWEASKNPLTVCSPDSKGSFAHCPHVSGCAVDVGFVFNRNNLYEGYSENLLEMKDSNQRTLLKKIMLEAGFKNYCPESWHFEYGTIGYQKAGTSDCYQPYWS